MILRFAPLACGILLSFPLYAADIYRWVDENGRTQISDIVPENYKKSATRIDSRQFELSAEQRREADARAAETAQRMARSDAIEAANAAAAVAASAASAAAESGPRRATKQGTDCATLRRLYRESLACFAPYVTAVGATKAEAFEKCTPVLDPVAKCGPVSN
ncbi:MAG: DUF4124 domain-containing protein [Polaromonas sp.]|uniref:DUF4124 domain-containing protein n=1 Tax=Polaromonas sp. TaxID=1869339 RepID=UPI0017964938|nr:DUF4124 domain-containing protein [Polaromonas sp.]NMM10039.1 DUF4124 domain-containing protein [Polaromonas sp.]